MSRKHGRKTGTRVVYTPAQTLRYQDQKSRRDRSLSLFPMKIEADKAESIYWFESKRAPDGFWRVRVGNEESIELTWEPPLEVPFLFYPNAISTFAQFAVETVDQLLISQFQHYEIATLRSSVIEVPADQPFTLGAAIQVSRTPNDPDYSPITGALYSSENSYVAPGAIVGIVRADESAAVFWQASYKGVIHQRYNLDEFTGEEPIPSSIDYWYFPPAFDVRFATSSTYIPPVEIPYFLYPDDENPDIDLGSTPVPPLTEIGGVIFGFGDWESLTSLTIPAGESIRLFVSLGNFSNTTGFDETAWDFSYAVNLSFSGGAGGGGEPGEYRCDCPDFSKKIGARPQSKFESEQKPRSWESSAAGSTECKHIMATKRYRNDE